MQTTSFFARALPLLSLALCSTPSSLIAYDFDETCAPTTVHDASKGSPDALIILDRSGSMDDPGGTSPSGASISKLSIAKTAVKELALAVYKTGPCTAMDRSGCDELRLGLGWFSFGGDVNVTPGEDTYSAIVSTVDAYHTNGGTETGAAAYEIYDSTELRNASRAGFGIFITDGEPIITLNTANAGQNRETIENTLHYLCAAREDHDILTFMVGFGAGADPRINSFFAAAGGTGRCCLKDSSGSCSYQPGELVDPCTFPHRATDNTRISTVSNGTVPYDAIVGSLQIKLTDKLECEGAKQADSAQALKDELLALVDQIACTFPLDIPNDYLRFPGADADPAATRVEFDHAILGNDIRIQPYDPATPNAFYDYLVNQRGISAAVADDYKNEGWYFADALRKTVRLTDKLCQEVQSSNVASVETQAACLCDNTGSDCNVPCEDANADGYDDVNGAACETDGAGDLVQMGRCQPGIVECIIGVEYCAPKYSIQPDVCNGIDDDCDGNIDNSSRANPAPSSAPDDSPAREAFEWNGNQSQLDPFNFDSALFCDYQDFSCSCGTNPAHDFGPSPTPGHPDPDHEWNNLLQSTFAQLDLCACNSALELEARTQQAELDASANAEELERSDASQAAGCQSVSHKTPSLPLSALLFLSGLFLLSVRRKRR